MITYYYSCFVISQPRLLQVRGLASARRPCPRRSRLGTSSHPLHPRKTGRYTLLASIAWIYIVSEYSIACCARVMTQPWASTDRRCMYYVRLRVHLRPRTHSKRYMFVYVRICAFCEWDAGAALDIALAHSRVHLGQFSHPPPRPRTKQHAW